MWNTECRHDADLMQTRRLRALSYTSCNFRHLRDLPNLCAQLDRQEAGRDNPQAVLTKTSETICR